MRTCQPEWIAWIEGWGARGRFYEGLGFEGTGERHPLREDSPLRVRILRREP